MRQGEYVRAWQGWKDRHVECSYLIVNTLNTSRPKCARERKVVDTWHDRSCNVPMPAREQARVVCVCVCVRVCACVHARVRACVCLRARVCAVTMVLSFTTVSQSKRVGGSCQPQAQCFFSQHRGHSCSTQIYARALAHSAFPSETAQQSVHKISSRSRHRQRGRSLACSAPPLSEKFSEYRWCIICCAYSIQVHKASKPCKHHPAQCIHCASEQNNARVHGQSTMLPPPCSTNSGAPRACLGFDDDVACVLDLQRELRMLGLG